MSFLEKNSLFCWVHVRRCLDVHEWYIEDNFGEGSKRKEEIYFLKERAKEKDSIFSVNT